MEDKDTEVTSKVRDEVWILALLAQSDTVTLSKWPSRSQPQHIKSRINTITPKGSLEYRR